MSILYPPECLGYVYTMLVVVTVLFVRFGHTANISSYVKSMK